MEFTLKYVINIEDIELKPRPKAFAATGAAAAKFDASTGAVSSRLGAQKLGYNLTSVPPGKCAFPFHNHHVNEELFLILQGVGELRIGDETTQVKPMDVIACPPGGPELAHQILNTDDADLKYLAISTMESPEYVEYPDSGKFGVYGNHAGSNQRIGFLGRAENGLDYWDGEG